jgi:LacI family transcriptional regulator
MAVTIKQIAELAGVAPTTVSLVLKDSRKVGADTKRKVLRIIEEMDYYPNHSGKLLKQGRTDAVAVISSYFQNLFKMELVNGIEREIVGTKFQLRQFYSETGAEEAKIKEVLYGMMADAVIAMGYIAKPEFLDKMRKTHKPVVLVEDIVPGYAGVTFDNCEAGYKAVEHFVRSGRRRIAISLAMKAYMGHCFVDDRLRGYMSALRDLGIEYSEIIELPDYTLDSGRVIYERITERANPPDAVFCASGDITAAAFMREAMSHGMRVPEDIAVMGIDNSIVAQTTTLGLTTIRQPIFEMGRAAFTLAQSMIDGDEAAYSKVVEFKPEIIVRDSA